MPADEAAELSRPPHRPAVDRDDHVARLELPDRRRPRDDLGDLRRRCGLEHLVAELLERHGGGQALRLGHVVLVDLALRALAHTRRAQGRRGHERGAVVPHRGNEPLEQVRLPDEDREEEDLALVVPFVPVLRNVDERRDPTGRVRQEQIAVGRGEPEDERRHHQQGEPAERQSHGREGALHTTSVEREWSRPTRERPGSAPPGFVSICTSATDGIRIVHGLRGHGRPVGREPHSRRPRARSRRRDLRKDRAVDRRSFCVSSHPPAPPTFSGPSTQPSLRNPSGARAHPSSAEW